MLDGLRAFSKTWVAKILLGVLVVSFAAFGINNVITDLGSSTVARVGDEEISVSEFQRSYNAQVNAFAQQYGQVPTAQEALAMGIPSDVLNGLAGSAAINLLGERMGLGVSEAKLGEMLREDPNFSGILGGFDRESFLRSLSQGGMTEAEYFEDQTKLARRIQLAQALFADAAVPQAAKQLINRYATDTRTIDYFVLNATSVATVPDPTEDELKAYLAERQADFRTVETRTVDLIALTPEALAATKTITEAEVAAEYEASKDQLVMLERRHIRQVALPSEGTAKWFEIGKTGGKTFDQMVVEAQLPVTDLGTLSQAEITDAALATAAFGLTSGDFAIIDGAAGKRAVSVAEIEPGGQIALDEAREDIRQRLALAAARNEYVDILDQIEELRAAFQPMATIAARYGLTLYTLAVSATGAELAQVPGIAEADPARVTEAIFRAEQGKLTPTIGLTANHNVWIELNSIEPARDQTLEEVRDAVLAAWTAEKTNDAIVAEVERITQQLEAGLTIQDAAAQLGQFPEISPAIKRDGTSELIDLGDGTTMPLPASNVLDASVANAVFAGGPGHFGAALNGDGDYVIFKVAEITPAQGEVSAETSAFIEGSAREGMFGEFVTGIRDEAVLRINQQVLSQLLGLDQPPGN